MEPAASPRILVVEDNPHSALVLERILGNHGFSVTVFHDGQSALEHLQQNGPVDVVVSDWGMPKLDGVALCQAVRADRDLRRIYFILLTSHDMRQQKIQALDAGVDDYLTKPAHEDELMARIRAGVRVRSLQNEVVQLERQVAIMQVAATAGHEINNPLTGVIGYLEFLQEGLKSGADPAKMVEYVDRIMEQAIRIRDIVNQLRELKEISTRPYLGRQEIIDLNTNLP